MKTGWVASDEKWYFMGESGVMQESGWVSYEGANYYLKGTGVMATDYIKDGYELDSTGKAIPMTQTKSVELTEDMDLTNKTIEGNLYIDAAKFKELELSGITVTGKIVIIGNDIKDSKITIKDSTVNTISTQARNAEIVLAGKTVVDSIQMEENATVKPDKDYTGKVATIEIQSTAKDEIKIEVPAKTVSSNTFAPVTINAPIDNLAVNKKTELKVNADVDNITVNKTATDTKVEVEKGSTVGSIASDTKVEVGGAGKVEEVKGDDITNETEKPSKPSGGGSGPVTPSGVGVSTEIELNTKLADTTVTEIYLKNSFDLTNPLVITRPVILNGNNKTLTITSSGLSGATYRSAVVVKVADSVTIKNLTVTVTGDASGWNGTYGIQVYKSTGTTLNNVTSKGADGGILINGATATLTGTTDVSGNEFGGIEVANGEGVSGASLTLGSGTVKNSSETYTNPTLWTIDTVTITGFDSLLHARVKADGKTHYYLDEKYAADVVLVKDDTEFLAALNVPEKDIVLTADISVASASFAAALDRTVDFDLNGKTMTLTGGKSILLKENMVVTFSNGNIIANEYNAGGSVAVFCPEVGSSITLDAINMTTNSVALYPRGNAAAVNVLNDSVVKAGVFGIGTNAATADNYNVVITIDSSTIETASVNKDNSAVLFNVVGQLNITDSVLSGDRHGLIVRGGTANVSNTTIYYGGGYNPSDEHYTTAWASGNNLPSAPVVIGNVYAAAYKFASNVTFTEVAIKGAIAGVSDDANGKQIVKVDVNVSKTNDEYVNYAVNYSGNIADDMIYTIENILKPASPTVVE